MSESELIITDQHDVNDCITFSSTTKNKRQIEIFKLITELKDIKADLKFYFYKGTRNLVAKFLKAKRISYKMKKMNLEDESSDDEKVSKKQQKNKEDISEDENSKNIKKKKKRCDDSGDDESKSCKKVKIDSSDEDDDEDENDEDDDEDNENNTKFVNIKNVKNKKYILTFKYDADIVATIKELNKDDREYNKDKHTWKITNKKSMQELFKKFKSKKIKYYVSE
jgi:cobalamin biosynthesis protein CobT